MTKLEAIAHLEKCFKHDTAYAKKWRDYIEIIITEQLERYEIEMPLKRLDALRRDIAEEIMDIMFQADWWKAQGS